MGKMGRRGRRIGDGPLGIYICNKLLLLLLLLQLLLLMVVVVVLGRIRKVVGIECKWTGGWRVRGRSRGRKRGRGKGRGVGILG